MKPNPYTVNSRDRSIPRPLRAAFTLIELLLVLVILAVLAAIVVPKFTGRTQDARIKAAKAEISNIKTALNTFEIDNGRFPAVEEGGLRALVEKPGDLPNWKQGLEKLPVDPWGNPYVYRCPGTNRDFDLFSCGPDGHEGGADDVEP